LGWLLQVVSPYPDASQGSSHAPEIQPFVNGKVLLHSDTEEVKSAVGFDVVSNVDLSYTGSVPGSECGKDDGCFSCGDWRCDALVDLIGTPDGQG
jgi:hypothetical protein